MPELSQNRRAGNPPPRSSTALGVRVFIAKAAEMADGFPHNLWYPGNVGLILRNCS